LARFGRINAKFTATRIIEHELSTHAHGIQRFDPFFGSPGTERANAFDIPKLRPVSLAGVGKRIAFYIAIDEIDHVAAIQSSRDMPQRIGIHIHMAVAIEDLPGKGRRRARLGGSGVWVNRSGIRHMQLPSGLNLGVAGRHTEPERVSEAMIFFKTDALDCRPVPRKPGDCKQDATRFPIILRQ
jgi:hypothetical protein